ncbi:MAG: hypothetical protein LBP33_01830 [Candidatus Adiutrix sp.]|nr:hypothetical protein [Candidatus Adiutrix sp.]
MSQFSEHIRPGRLKTAADARVQEREAAVDEKPFRLAKSFSLVAIVMIFAAVMILAAAVSRQAEVIITKRVEDDTLKLIQNLNFQMFVQFLQPMYQQYGKTSLKEAEQQQRLEEVITNTIEGFDLRRVLIYDEETRVVYATDETEPRSQADDARAIKAAIDLYAPLPLRRGLGVGPTWYLGLEMLLRQPNYFFPSRPGHWPPYNAPLFEPPGLKPEDRPDLSPTESPEYKYPDLISREADLNRRDLAEDDQGERRRVFIDDDDYLDRVRAQTIFRYEGGGHLLFKMFPRGNFVLRSYKVMQDYQSNGISGVLEIDRDLTPEYQQIARLQYFALSVAAFLALALTIGLRWVVSRGEDIITKRNLERQALREQLEQAERLAGLGSMVATVAHEIRNPLGIIHSTADVLNRFLAGEPDRARLAQAIVEEANRLSDVVTEFLDFARPPTPRLAPVVVEEILEEILALLEVTLARAGVEVRTELRPEPGPIPGDGPMLHRAFLNLLMNAVQAMDDGGLITVATSLADDPQKGACLVVSISDTGPGLNEEAAKKLFSPFYTTKAKGTGLGLVIVRNIIEGHQGDISLKNGPPPASPDDGGPGLTATIRLKIRPEGLIIEENKKVQREPRLADSQDLKYGNHITS